MLYGLILESLNQCIKVPCIKVGHLICKSWHLMADWRAGDGMVCPPVCGAQAALLRGQGGGLPGLPSTLQTLVGCWRQVQGLLRQDC